MGPLRGNGSCGILIKVGFQRTGNLKNVCEEQIPSMLTEYGNLRLLPEREDLLGKIFSWNNEDKYYYQEEAK